MSLSVFSLKNTDAVSVSLFFYENYLVNMPSKFKAILTAVGKIWIICGGSKMVAEMQAFFLSHHMDATIAQIRLDNS